VHQPTRAWAVVLAVLLIVLLAGAISAVCMQRSESAADPVSSREQPGAEIRADYDRR
jgi:hypothetical protein